MFTLETINNVAYNFAYDWLMIALTKIFVIIAVLQLVKKIPDIINTVFGTHIQSRGGIKGRLGEMAGIGGLAQKAWTSLGTGAKNLAKLGLTAPFAIGALGADKLYKKNHDGKSLRDTKTFRQVKGIGAGLRKAWQSGSALQAYKEYDTASAPPQYQRSDRLKAQQSLAKSAQQRIINGLSVAGFTEKPTNLIDESGNVINAFTDSSGNNHFVAPDVLNNTNDSLKKMLNNFGKAGEYKKAALEAQELKTGLEGIASKRDAAIDFLEKYQTRASRIGDTTNANLAGILKNKIRDGKSLNSADYAFLAQDDSDLKDASAQIMKYQNESIVLKNKFAEYNGDTSTVSMGILIGNQDGKIKAANQKYDIEKDLISVIDQDAISFIETASGNVLKTLNGAYQNNGSVYSLFKTNGDFKYDAGTGEFKDPSGAVKSVSSADSNYAGLIKNGIVRTSSSDYGISVKDFDSFVSEVTQTHTAGSPGYYSALHNKIRTNYGSNTDVMNRLQKIEDSNLLP